MNWKRLPRRPTLLSTLSTATTTATATATETTTTTTATMNSLCFIIITFFFIAGYTSASEAFKDDGSIRAEADAYCLNPDGYENSEGGRKYGPIEGWNVSAVTSMKNLFRRFKTCNPPISNWDVGAVKSFERMFYRAVAFNQDLSEWNVANGRYFHNMFAGAAAFNQDLSEWNVANGQRFRSMFNKAAAFNQDLSGWNVTKGRNFILMFKNSGMNYFIGEWDFKSMGNDARKIRIFFSMLGITEIDAFAEWEQLNNLIITCAKK